jgi:hypothetical protein
MKYAVVMCSDAMIYMPSFVKNGSGIQNTRDLWPYRQHGDRISLFSFFQSKESRLKILARVWVSVTNNNGFWIWWLGLLALLYNYNQLWQLTISDCLRLAPFLTGPPGVFSSTVTNAERRISARTLNSLNDVCLTNAIWWISWIYEWTPCYNE